MSQNCKEHNTDYVTKNKKLFVKKTDNEVVIWTAPNKCVVYKQLVFDFKLT